MWRLAVITKQPSFINKISLKTLCKAWKHNDSRPNFLRYVSSDASAVRRDDRPIQELFNLEDFGLLSVSRNSLTSASSFEHDQTFIDHLFRNDTQIPTTIDSNELGGSNDATFEQNLEFLAEDIEQELEYLHDQQPSTSKSDEKIENTPFLMANFMNFEQKPENSVKTRQFLTENVRRERKLTLSTTNFSSNEIGQMLFPEDIPAESFTSNWENVEKLKESTEKNGEKSEESIFSEISLEILEDFVAEKKIEQLHLELKNGHWPEYLFEEGDRRTIAKLNNVLRFYLENWNAAEDVEEVLHKITKSNILAVISDDILVSLTAKFSNNQSSESILKKFDDLIEMCPSRELRPNRKMVNNALRSLYNSSLENDFENCQKIFTKCIDNHIDRSAELYLNCLSEYSLKNFEEDEKKTNFKKNFELWKKLSTKYGKTSGVDNFWMMILSKKGETKKMAKEIEELLMHSNQSDHPFTTMAHMICAFIRLNDLDKAIEVFKTVSVSGRHFRTPLTSFVEKVELENIEKLGEVIERGIIGERRRKRAIVKEAEDSVTINEKKLDPKVLEVLSKFYGLSTKNKKKSTFINKKQKRKIHKVDEEQLHELCEAMQEAWIKCAEEKKDGASAKRLKEWCERNRIEVDEKIIRRIEKLE